MRSNLNFPHYYKLRTSYQSDLATATIEKLDNYRKAALDMISDQKFSSNFELERLGDFVDEVEDRILKFEEYRKLDQQKVKKFEERQLAIRKPTPEQPPAESILDIAKKDGIFQDSNGDLIFVVKKSNLKELRGVFERASLISSALLTKNYTMAAKMMGVTPKSFRAAKIRYDVNLPL